MQQERQELTDQRGVIRLSVHVSLRMVAAVERMTRQLRHQVGQVVELVVWVITEQRVVEQAVYLRRLLTQMA